jgi:hypothetical protein
MVFSEAKPLDWQAYVLTAVWLGAIGVFLQLNWHFDFQSGKQNPAPRELAKNWKLNLQPNCYTLLMFVHPRCACSRASLAELKKILQRCSNVRATVLFFAPSESGKNWTQTDLWQSALAIEHVKVISDADARIAKHFGSLTSGHCLLYNPSGKLCFSGGITAARGHVGDNFGAEQIVTAASKSSQSSIVKTSVFGCQIANP